MICYTFIMKYAELMEPYAPQHRGELTEEQILVDSIGYMVDTLKPEPLQRSEQDCTFPDRTTFSKTLGAITNAYGQEVASTAAHEYSHMPHDHI